MNHARASTSSRALCSTRTANGFCNASGSRGKRSTCSTHHLVSAERVEVLPFPDPEVANDAAPHRPYVPASAAEEEATRAARYAVLARELESWRDDPDDALDAFDPHAVPRLRLRDPKP